MTSYVFQCPGCHRKQQLATGTFMEGAYLPVKKLLALMYFWAYEEPVSKATAHTHVSSRLWYSGTSISVTFLHGKCWPLTSILAAQGRLCRSGPSAWRASTLGFQHLQQYNPTKKSDTWSWSSTGMQTRYCRSSGSRYPPAWRSRQTNGQHTAGSRQWATHTRCYWLSGRQPTTN